MTQEILIVDDEADIRSLIGGILSDEGYEVREAHDADSALEAVKKRRPKLVLLDIWLEYSRLDGMGILDVILRDFPGLPVVMISGHGTIETAVKAIQMGAYDFLEKPFESDRLLVIVKRAIEAADLKMENEELRLRSGQATEFLGQSAAMQQLRQSIDKVAPTNSRILIQGPPGCGKEMAARLLHNNSHRAEAPFVVMNCATITPDRFEVELFGTESEREDLPRKIGLLERAHGGTLLLDEVGDMPQETQGKMVRALQEQHFERVGGTAKVEVDVRVISSTSRDLDKDMGEGRFRRDLFFRLNVVPLRVPSLKVRVEDVPELCDYFMKLSSDASGLPPRRFGEDAIASLQAYDWPGNVRQLRNVIDWMLIMAPGHPDEPLHADSLPPEIGSAVPDVFKWDQAGEIMSLPLRDARELFEREYLAAQVNRFGGNISRTSSFVGMERSALHRKLKSLGLTGSRDAEDKDKKKAKKNAKKSAKSGGSAKSEKVGKEDKSRASATG